ncbi:Leu/Phe/Val dehydrogenase [Candidatus Nitronereus thalassa]|uniref:Glu/Leu/Phe/Val dehydrogenase dimerization domain-containing protein n=1 Tax=Candidatus Nitronereus thalassa TaxID=3020898 RepID=A0ABU3K921_9BACT|nr:Glu/Leu/Phe/Val dehydrogenase dimerization domain-containing protein [Candidatus Nitronereus thalassa]MDT7042862.1 Glu/Leu/Phe/Val dehydrogenase dimerization domain-containing protein [Candidatus Nitronereus thalassa]
MLEIKHLKVKGFETVAVGKDPAANFHAIIAVHSTRLGPSLGGIRMWPYKNEKEALQDVLRLANAMSKKAAISGLQVGGGKAVIIGNPEKEKTPTVLHLMGALIDSLKGQYIAAKDSGIVPEDLNVVSEKTRHVTGTTGKHGGSGDPSLSTAKGVLKGMQAASQVVFGSQNLNNRVVAIQGVGHVGWNLGNLLVKHGANLIVADLQQERAARAQRAWKAEVVPLSRIHRVPADIFAPCALGGVLNAKTIPQLRASIVAGGANNQFLDEERDPYLLMRRNIVHVPDYVLNAGGLIQLVVREVLHQRRVASWINNIQRTVRQVLTESLRDNLPPLIVANRLALEKIGT